MPLIDLTAIAIGLAMDALAVSIAVSILLGQVTKRQVFRIAFHFGLFQALMPILGWLAGATFARFIESWDHWLAFVILLVLGVKMIYEAQKDEAPDAKNGDPSRGLVMVVLSIAVSIDALAVGLSFAMLNISVWFPALIIGLVATLAGVIGMVVGRKLGAAFGRYAATTGGIVLIGIGIKIVLDHTLLA